MTEPSILLGKDERTGKPHHFPLSDWKTNMHIIGPPASGKTSLSFVLATQLIMMGKPVFILDPLGVLFWRLHIWLSYQPPEIQQRAVIFNPGGTGDYYPGHNPFRKMFDDVDVSVQAMGLVDIITKACTTNADEAPLIMKNIMDFADPLINGGYTFAELHYFTEVGHSPARQKFAHMASLPEVTRAILALDEAHVRDQPHIVCSLDRRLPRLTRALSMQSILGRTNNTISFEEIIEDRPGKFFLGCFAPKAGLLHQRHGQVLASLILNDLANYLMTRSAEQAKAQPVYIFIDEFELVMVDGIATMLDTLRNFGARWVLSHQRLGQLVTPESTDLLSAVLTDCRARFVFGGLPEEDMKLLGGLMTMGDLDLDTIRDEVSLPMVTHYQERELQSRSEATNWAKAEHEARARGTTSGTSDMMTEDGEFVFGDHDATSESEIHGNSSSRGGVATKGVSTTLEGKIEWLRSHTTYWSTPDLQYMAMVDMFKRPPAHVTFRNLAEPRIPLKVAHAEEMPLDPRRLEANIECSLDANSHFYERQQDTLSTIRTRHEALEAPQEKKGRGQYDSQERIKV